MASPAKSDTSSNEWLCTQTRGDCVEFEWTIKKFHLLPEKNGEGIHSPVFPDNSTDQWCLDILPQGDKEEDAGWISIYLWPASAKMLGIKIEYQIIVLRSNEILGTAQFMHKFKKKHGYGHPRFVERSKLSVQDDPTDTITIRCKIKVLGTHITSSSKTKSSDMVVTFTERKNRITKNFQSLHKNLTLTDFTVISGDKTFPTHKIILASRCPAFATMFQPKEEDENVENELKIENIEPAVVEGLLEFIYTDNVSKIGELAHGLLASAEQYGLKDLKHLCEETLYKTLNENNAAELLVLADLHNAHQLKKYTMQYVAANLKKVAQSEAFELMKLPEELSKEIIRALALSANEKPVTCECDRQ